MSKQAATTTISSSMPSKRNKLLEFLWKMRQDDGSFTMHEGGEADTRSVYCAASVAALTGLLDEDVELFDNSVGWLVRYCLTQC